MNGTNAGYRGFATERQKEGLLYVEDNGTTPKKIFRLSFKRDRSNFYKSEKTSLGQLDRAHAARGIE
jgi:hypothetical protein